MSGRLNTSVFGRPERKRSRDFPTFKEDPSSDLSKKSTLEAVVAYGRLCIHDQLDEANAIEPVVARSSSFPHGSHER